MDTGGSLPRVYSGRGVKLTTHIQVVQRPRKRGRIYPLFHKLHDVVLNLLSTGTTLPFPYIYESEYAESNFSDLLSEISLVSFV
jgi:hypothetical protein